MEKLFCLILLIFLNILTVLGQSNKTQCFVDGECRHSTLLKQTITLGENGCLHFCQMVEGCKWFTYHIGQSLCTAMSECNELSSEICGDCLTGHRECAKQENQCWITGLCQGHLISEVPVDTPEECLDFCLSTIGCKWFSFVHISSACFIFEDCPTIDESCISCVSSTAKCRGKTSFTKLLVIGGSTPSGLTNEVEIIDLETSETTCANVAKFPAAIDGAVGGLRHSSNPLVCGGYPYNKDCYLLNYSGEWETFGLMNEVRRHAAISASPYPTERSSFFVTGGIDEFGNVTKSSEYLNENTWDSKSEMPITLNSHCMILLNSSTIMVTGGVSPEIVNNETFFFNPESKKWTIGPALNQKRSWHSCARIRKSSQSYQFSIIVVGGWDGANWLSSTEVYDEELGVWNYGPELPFNSACATLTEDPTGGVFQVGGEKENDDRFFDGIYRLSHAGPDGEWVKMPQKLSTGKNRHVAFMVPDEIADCQLSSH